MNRMRFIAIAAVLLIYWETDTWGQELKITAHAKSPVRVNIRITNEREQWYVGDEVEVAATVTNISESVLLIPNWDQPSLQNEPMWQLYADVKSFPDATKGRPMTTFHGGTGSVDSPDCKQLAAANTSQPKTKKFVTMLPGKMSIYATFSCTFLGVERMAEKGIKRFDYPYRRAVVMSHGEQAITLPANMSPTMAAEYEQLSKTILRQETPVKERLNILSRVARQKHYFAARFVWDIWKQTKDSEVKNAALLHLIDLLEWGTAYETMPELLDALAEEATPLDARKRMLDVLGKMYLTSEYPGFRIADMAGYRLPEGVHRKALKVIKQLDSSF